MCPTTLGVLHYFKSSYKTYIVFDLSVVENGSKRPVQSEFE